ncbi:hypothetical protein [Pedobacter sp. R-06]|uniref:hypothetical protein n=1 Tax=Pedobacter sp. R-06 TaxID=3404051 RepID=UPI003CF987B4
MAITVPLFGSSSDEGSEALPGNRVYLTWAGTGSSNLSSANSEIGYCKQAIVN